MNRTFNDLTGKRFGSLLIIDRAKNDKWGHARWNYICDCGKKGVAAGGRLTYKKEPIIHRGCLTFNDLSGQRFGSLLIIDRAKSDERGKSRWNYICDCGKKGVVVGFRLTCKKDPKNHCGCLSNQHNSDSKKTHGLSKTLEYDAEIQHKRRIKKQNNNLAFNLSYAESLKIARPKLDYCVYCGSTDNLTIDHIIPINKGGTQNPKNLIRACRSCNSAKNASFFIDWYIKTKRCKRSLTGIIADMNFDSIFHLQHYQDSMCPDYYEKNRSSVAAKILRAKVKNNKLLDRYYQSLNHYPTH